MGFGDTKTAHDVLIIAQPGDVFEIEVKKNDRGYNDWVAAVKNGTPSASPSPTYAPNTSPKTGGVTATTSPKSTYETPEERAKKQIYIVRQSSISSAISALAIGSKSTPDVDKVIETAKRFEDYVFGTTDNEVSVGSSFFPDSPKVQSSSLPMDDDIPF